MLLILKRHIKKAEIWQSFKQHLTFSTKACNFQWRIKFCPHPTDFFGNWYYLYFLKCQHACITIVGFVNIFYLVFDLSLIGGVKSIFIKVKYTPQKLFTDCSDTHFFQHDDCLFYFAISILLFYCYYKNSILQSRTHVKSQSAFIP